MAPKSHQEQLSRMFNILKPLTLWWTFVVAIGVGVVVSSQTIPSNDECNSALLLSLGQASVAGTTVSATAEINYDCGNYYTQGLGVPNTAPGVWYQVVGNNRRFQVSTCNPGTDFGTAIQIFSDTCDALTCIAGAKADATCTSNSLASTVAWDSVENIRYLIFVFGREDSISTGNFELSLQDFIPPSNDFCLDAPLLQLNGGTTTASTVNATAEINYDCGNYYTQGLGVPNTAPGVWYQVVGNNRRFQVSTCNPGTDFGTAIQIFSDTCDALTCIAGAKADATCTSNSLASTVAWDSVENIRYLIFVFGREDSISTGNFELSLQDFIPPSNDFCLDAPLLQLNGGTTTASTVNATAEINYDCGNYYTQGLGVPNTAPGVWYQVVGNNRRFQVSTCNLGTDFETAIQIFSDTCDALTCIAGAKADATCTSNSLASTVAWDSVENIRYLIFVFGREDSISTGNFELSLQDFIPPSNDFCLDAPLLQLNGGTTTASTVNATAEINYDCGNYYTQGLGVPNTAPGVWYRVAGTGGTVTVSSCHDETTLATAIQIFSGTCDGLTCITGASVPDVNCQNLLSTEVSWKTTSGESYFILIFGRNAGETGSFAITALDNSASVAVPTGPPIAQPIAVVPTGSPINPHSDAPVASVAPTGSPINPPSDAPVASVAPTGSPINPPSDGPVASVAPTGPPTNEPSVTTVVPTPSPTDPSTDAPIVSISQTEAPINLPPTNALEAPETPPPTNASCGNSVNSISHLVLWWVMCSWMRWG